jgi:RNA polymerase sigma factor FliA
MASQDNAENIQNGNSLPSNRAVRAQNVYLGDIGKKKPQWNLVEQYLPLVKSISQRMRAYFPTHVDIEDIYSIGVSGLITATQNYDVEKNPSFGNYASIRVRGAMLDELRRMDWLPRVERVNLKKFRKIYDELEQELKRPPTDGEVQEAMGISAKELKHIKSQPATISFVPLDSCPDEQGNNLSLQEMIPDSNQVDGRDVAERRELINLLRVGLDKLPEMPKKVLAMYYLKGLRLTEIAVAVELTESRVCQIHTQAISELRGLLQRQLSEK